jgi:phospholipase/carboxylesterase
MSDHRITRRACMRELACLTGGALIVPWVGGCARSTPERLSVTPASTSGPPTQAVRPGLRPIGSGGERDGVMYLPSDTAEPAPLLLLLHGAGGNGRRVARLLLPLAEQAGCVLVAPDSRDATWDGVAGAFGPDVRYIERVLSETLGRRPIDPRRMAIAGFSDGATYALGLGRANGDLFTHLIAYSPGFLTPSSVTGLPRVFVSHGRSDGILPIDRCSRVLVPQLRHDGYDVRYREFEGGHEVPDAVVRQSLGWFLGPGEQVRPHPQ